MKTKVTFLSLGPGDPELLTLKAVRTLREADVVLVPATQGSDGTGKSRAADIIKEWCSDERLHLFLLPMQKDRKAVMQVYDKMCQEVADDYHAGQCVVIVVEGDVSIYASIHYVLDRLQTEGIPVEQVPGIPSFIAAAAMADLSLVSQKERLVVLPGDADETTLQQLLISNHVVVVMKLSQCAEAVKEYLRRHPHTVCHYFENVGTAEAFHTTDRDVIQSRQISYFSLCVLYPA